MHVSNFYKRISFGVVMYQLTEHTSLRLFSNHTCEYLQPLSKVSEPEKTCNVMQDGVNEKFKNLKFAELKRRRKCILC
jgi:hypothetical protein